MAAKKKGAAASVRFTPIGSYPVLNRIKRLRSCCSPIRSDSILPRTKRLRYYSSLIRSNLIRFGPPAAKEAALLLHFNSIRSSYRQKRLLPLLLLPFDSVLGRQKRSTYCFSPFRPIRSSIGKKDYAAASVRFGSQAEK